MSVAESLPPVPWKGIALPVEHGGWGFLVEPVLLGLALAPSRPGLALALAALCAFLARHPLRLVLLDRRRGVRHPRTALAERFFVAYAGLVLVALVLASSLAPAFWPALLAAAPLGLVAVHHDARGRSREAVAEAAGAGALASSAPAIALAGGVPAGPAFGAWALLALRAVASILYVRARIRLDRGLPAGSRSALASHLAALVGAVALARVGWGPWTCVTAFAILLARAAWGLSGRRAVVRPQVIGFQELGFGLLTLVLLAAGYRSPGGRPPWL